MKSTLTAVCLVVAVAGLSRAEEAAEVPQTPSEPALEKRIEEIADELRALREELRTLKARAEASDLHPAPAPAAAEPAQSVTPAAPAPNADHLSLWGYGEAYYTRPTKTASLAEADLARAVFGIGYQFDERTRFNSEFEVEHAVSSAADVGEFEVEQFYVDRKLNEALSFQAGLFLIPTGLLNEHHEPTNFYGVQRNFVETLIIPSTWREGGVALQGTTDWGLTWNLGVTTGLNLSSWDFQAASPQYRTALQLEDRDVAPLQATHQELALADARHPSEFAAVNFRGVPGLVLGGSLFTGKAVPVQDAPDDERVTLFEGHARYQPGPWDISGLYARGTLSSTALANLESPGAPNPLPAAFDGWYLQAARNAWHKGNFRIAPFVRYERYNMAASYEGLIGAAPSLEAAPVPRDAVFTVGSNVYINPGVVFKVDYQDFRNNSGFSRVDLSLGLSF